MVINSNDQIIPGWVQREYFSDITPIINVLLPNGSWTKWELCWYSLGGRSKVAGMKGEVYGRWFEFYKDTFKRLRDTVAGHWMQL